MSNISSVYNAKLLQGAERRDHEKSIASKISIKVLHSTNNRSVLYLATPKSCRTLGSQSKQKMLRELVNNMGFAFSHKL